MPTEEDKSKKQKAAESEESFRKETLARSSSADDAHGNGVHGRKGTQPSVTSMPASVSLKLLRP
jgi:hypothetical protein